MCLDTMLAASSSTPTSAPPSTANDSSDLAALNRNSSQSHTKADLDLDLDLLSAAERRIAESVSQELDYWEKLVFAFDMERDPGRSGQQPDAGSDTRARGKRRGDDTNASSSFIPGSSSSGSSAEQSHQQPSGSRHPLNPQFPLIEPNSILSGQQPNLLPQQLNQLSGLDPYTLAHLAALSALQQGQQGQRPHGGQVGQQAANFQDPAAVLQQLHNLMYPFGNAGQASPGRGSPIQNIGPGSPQLQRFPSAGFNRPGTQQHHPHSLQPSPSESSGQRWPPQVPSINPLLFPPIDPVLANQLSQLSQSFLPSTYLQQPTHAQTPGAGPSASGSRARSRSTTSSGSPTPVSPTSSRAFVDESAMTEDKRRRNTLASGMATSQSPSISSVLLIIITGFISARFRIKKKHKTLALERSVVELEARADDLEREASELRRENGWLKEMLIMKGRTVRAQAAAAKAALEQAEEEEEDEEEEEGIVSEEEVEDENRDGKKDVEDEPDIKGKGKAKAA